MTIEYTKQGNVGIITINRPDARNAVNSDVASGIEDAIDQIEADDEVWVGILTGARTEKGYIFCAGADLKQMATDPGGMTTAKGGFAGFVQRERTTPIIAAVDGPALAGGTEIVLAADLVVASRTAVFGIPEVKRNLVAGAGGLFRLPRKIPRNIAMELALTGRLDFPAERAYDFGMVNRLCDEGQALDTALELAAEITENAPLAVAESRQIMLKSTDEPDEVGWKLSGEGMMKMFGTEDFGEGLTAFAEKRKPNWKGR
ncbi:crotonase/enoyl-CoA hydratase family protein [Dermatobacter hominis]|uniref:crotonase/enoyl-CoA hydratase family protein n=1 Tax=Dermatobacter hominis TaxID=2884263 RepID=UPI001D0F6690|nr:crotonase/enoyl-CoA hydratase family protein [Dermatobacter hominis]UDY36372.1 crotonase/enoyl-CoA hydratase family protein [Dermatobacter hominis]